MGDKRPDGPISDNTLNVLESLYSPNGARLFDLDVVDAVRELRRLREENARLKAFADDVVDSFDCDCHEDYYKPGEKCFYCKAKEALPKSPEVKP